MRLRPARSFVSLSLVWFSTVLLLAGCISDTITIPPEAPRRVELPTGTPTLRPGSALEREHKQLVAGFGGEYRAPGVQAILNEIAERLRLVSDRPNEHFRVTILNSPVVNAFALPNGYVYLTRGLLVLANDTSEIASVLAHEIAHVTTRHAMERAELESRSVLVSRVMKEVLDNPGASQFMRDQSKVALASFSRQQEIDADEIGVRAIAKAGFEAHGATRFLNALDRSAKMRESLMGKGQQVATDILSTHPSTPERIEKAVSTARQYGTPGIGEANRANWLQALNGMVYGDDPNEGIIQGRSFLHPKLRFALNAPDGFVLENTPHAVLGVLPGAKEALRLDSSKVSPQKPLTVILAETPIEGIPVTGLSEFSIGNLPAATGLARGADWTFRIVIIRVGENLYRLIFAAQDLSGATDARFMEAAQSFRLMSADEVTAIRSQRIGFVAARIGESAADIVNARMDGIEQGLERFLVLNGLGAEELPIPGQAYKIITR